MQTSLENQVGVITGGSRGIGFRIAEALLENGAQVVIGSRQEESLRKAVEALKKIAPSGVFGVGTDVRDSAQVERLMDSAEKQFGGIDILVNNAGVGIFRAVDEMTPEEWNAVVETNLTGCFYCVRAAVPRMKRRGGGYIFNISSLAGKNAFAGGAAYNASKFGLNGFSEAIMLDLRYHNIRVSYILPGSVETSFGHPSAEAEKRTAGWKLDPGDVAQVVVDLLKSDPRAMISRVEIRPSQPPRK